MKLVRGFTLIELMITVVVIAILAAIAYPNYLDQVRKGRRAEGRDALLAIAQAQERYYTVNGSYAANLANLQVGSVVDCSKTPCVSREEGHYQISLAATANTFTATATPTGAQAGDACKSMTINQVGVRGGTGSDCW